MILFRYWKKKKIVDLNPYQIEHISLEISKLNSHILLSLILILKRWIKNKFKLFGIILKKTSYVAYQIFDEFD